MLLINYGWLIICIKSVATAEYYQMMILDNLNRGYIPDALKMAGHLAGSGHSLTSNNSMLAIGATKIPTLGLYSQVTGAVSFGVTALSFAGFMADDNASLTQYLDNVSNNAVSFYAENF
ncbi:hypothetical protein BEL05_07140 [Shewanella colwelliana]|uniref:Uncharacterized protein n=1 Tax=Shewanella colwelliana TaxID=23 RepID=A0A1E5IRK1_SHECO|nr:hypothetical protein [Shewanella colwelliana]OEG73161.1 hypothetical protein BEL05_07140 [Shewanella colwelliana]